MANPKWKAIYTWTPVLILVLVNVGLLIYFGRPILIIFLVFAGICLSYIALQKIEKRSPKAYDYLKVIGYFVVGALIVTILVGGMIRSCRNSEYECTPNASRAGQC